MATAPGVAPESFSASGISLEPSAAWRARASLESEAENHVAALVAAVTDYVLPIFFVIVGLLLGPGLAGRENKSPSSRWTRQRRGLRPRPR